MTALSSVTPIYVPLTFSVPEHLVVEAYQLMTDLVQRGLKGASYVNSKKRTNVQVRADDECSCISSVTSGKKAKYPNLRDVLGEHCACGNCLDNFAREHATPWRYCGVKGNFAWNPRKGEVIPERKVCSSIRKHFSDAKYDDRIGFVKHDIRGEELRLRAKQVKLLEDKVERNKITQNLANRKQVVELETALEKRVDDIKDRRADGSKVIKVGSNTVSDGFAERKSVEVKQPRKPLVSLVKDHRHPEQRYGRFWKQVATVLDEEDYKSVLTKECPRFQSTFAFTKGMEVLGSGTIIGLSIMENRDLFSRLISKADKIYQEIRQGEIV